MVLDNDIIFFFHNMVLSLLNIIFCHRIKKDTILLSSILLRLSEIWNQSEWVTNLLDFFEDAQFRTSVYNIVAFFEDQLTMSTTENSNGIDHKEKLSYSTLFALLPLLLPLLLKVKKTKYHTFLKLRL